METTNVRTIVVTGGTKGLGRAISEVFGRQGWRVFVCARTPFDLGKAQTDWEQQLADSQLFTFQADVSKKSEVMEFVQYIRANTQRVDVLVNNAGVFIPGQVTQETDGVLETLMETNLYSAYHLTRGLLPLFGKGTHLFNMCSVASLIAYPNGGSYSISKFALLGFTKALREELKSEGIKVTAVLPGATWSDSWLGVALPEDRLMQASDIAKMIWATYDLSEAAVVEELLIRPQLGDL